MNPKLVKFFALLMFSSSAWTAQYETMEAAQAACGSQLNVSQLIINEAFRACAENPVNIQLELECGSPPALYCGPVEGSLCVVGLGQSAAGDNAAAPPGSMGGQYTYSGANCSEPNFEDPPPAEPPPADDDPDDLNGGDPPFCPVAP